MSDQPPRFTYHPRAYELELIEQIDIECECCGQERGWIYSGSVYTTADVDNVCPWCIADGSAHLKWDASFSQDIEGVTIPGETQVDGASAESTDVVMHRTPGYRSWQGAVWKTHCGDVCEFHGDISNEELATLDTRSEALFQQDHAWVFKNYGTLTELSAHYSQQGGMSLYKFVCQHCGIVRIHADLC